MTPISNSVYKAAPVYFLSLIFLLLFLLPLSLKFKFPAFIYFRHRDRLKHVTLL